MKHREGTFKGFEGCNLYFQSWHPEAGASKGIIALIHGLGGHSGILHNIVESLVCNDYEVYAMDLRGHGRSMGQRGHINAWNEFRQDLGAFLQHIRQQRSRCSLVLFGHSLGGTIVLDYALRFPDHIQGVIVTAPALSHVKVPPHKLLVGQAFSTFFPRFSLPAGLSKELATADRVALAAYLQDPLRHEFGSARLVTEFFHTVDWIHYHASEFRVPLLLLHGTDDRVTSPAGSRAFFERVLFPDKTHQEYTGGSHDMYDDLAYQAVFSDITRWLDIHLENADRCDPHRGCMLVHKTAKALPRHARRHTLIDLLDTACKRYPNATAFNQWHKTGWQTDSNQCLQQQVEAIALGLIKLDLVPGDRVALLMRSNRDFIKTDLSCLLAGLVDVPIDLTQTLEKMLYILEHSAAKAMFVSDRALLEQLLPYLTADTQLRHIILAQAPADWPQSRISIQAPSGVEVHALDAVQALGEAERDPDRLANLRRQLQPDDLATIIYIPDSCDQLIGVMLTHANITGNVIATFGELPDLGWGDNETALTFLPLNHIFARQLLYGHIYYGHSIYFSEPRRAMRHIQEIQPTALAVVPLLLEKVYEQIRDRGQKLAKPWEKAAFDWSLKLAQRHELGQPTGDVYPVLLQMADKLVLRHWRGLFGGRLKYLLCGGATLKAEIANVLTAAGLPILQGYGLTQSAGVACFNRPSNNRSGTVGEPIPGVELAIAPDQEILLRGPFISAGYYQDPDTTRQLIDAQGWLHTGDLGSMTTDGQLQITGLKKSLFKLSTGKYIAPKPIEARLMNSDLVAHVMLVGADRKFCGALIFPDMAGLRQQGGDLARSMSDRVLLQNPCVLEWYQKVVDQANCHLPYWAMIKRFRLVHAELSTANGLLNDQQQIHRYRITHRFSLEIAALYGDELPEPRLRKKQAAETPIDITIPTINCPIPPTVAACPIEAQSLSPRFTM